MVNLSKREKYLVILIAVLAIFYAYYSLFLSPMLNKIKNEKSKVETYTLQLNNINSIKNTNKTLNVELKNLREKNDENLKILPNFERNPEIAYKLKVMADNNKVNLNNINFSEPATYNISSSSYNSAQQNNNSSNNDIKSSMNNFPKGSLLNIPVNFRVVGSYDNVLNFIAAIENGDRMSIINTIKLTSQINDTNSTDIITDITLDYFYINSSTTEKPDYDFNKGTYGKDNPFK